MAEYLSSYTGAEIDAGIGKANTAVQPADLNAKQDTIDSSHKLSADLVDDTSTTNKFVTVSDKTTWNGKQDALVSGTNIKTINLASLLGSGDIKVASVYEISETNITQADLQYIYENEPDLLKVTTSTNTIQDYHYLTEKMYGCLIGGTIITLQVYIADSSYSIKVESYNIDSLVPVSGSSNDGTNWSSITIDGMTRNIPSDSAPQLIATKIVDSNDDPYNPMFNFPSITELQPGHYYLVTKTDWTEGMISGVVEFIVFDRVQGGGESDQHFATGTVVFWQDGTTPSPTGTVYDSYADCLLEIAQQDGGSLWSLWITAGANAFNDGAEIKLYYKPL